VAVSPPDLFAIWGKIFIVHNMDKAFIPRLAPSRACRKTLQTSRKHGMMRITQIMEGKMPNYKHTEAENGQGMFLTVNLKEQLLPGAFEYMLNDLIGNKIDISIFDKNYKNLKDK
jgi:hypothetical protein